MAYVLVQILLFLFHLTLHPYLVGFHDVGSSTILHYQNHVLSYVRSKTVDPVDHVRIPLKPIQNKLFLPYVAYLELLGGVQ